MLDIFFTVGQAASALLLLYGAFLTLMPARKARGTSPMLEGKRFLLPAFSERKTPPPGRESGPLFFYEYY